ncbi:helix-turn-helix domain-containing protein [Bacteroides sp.]
MADITNEKKREIAEDMYIRIGLTGREIADSLGVTEQTVSRWKKGRDGEKNWDDRKKEAQLTPVRIKELLMTEAHKIASGEESTINSDGLSKLMAVIDRLDKKINVRTVMDVFKLFDNWMAEQDPATAVLFTKFHKLFLQYSISLEA